MNKIKSKIKESWPGTLAPPLPFPFEEEYPETGINHIRKSFAPPEYILRCAGVILILAMATLLGQIWGDPRFSNVHQSLDIQDIQESIPLVREYLLSI